MSTTRKTHLMQKLCLHKSSSRSSRFHTQLRRCSVYYGPFRGSLYGVTSSWQPRGCLKEYQDALPCQPVPPLRQTMERFLASVRPLLDDEEYARAVKLTDDFSHPGSDGAKLQNILEKRAEENENWLAEWWIKVIYLENRDPVTFFSNPCFVSKPMEQFSYPGGRERGAALAIASLLNQKVNVDNQTIPTEFIGKTPQCMMQYYHIFGCTRVPGDNIDHVVCYHSQDVNAPRHITVICNNQFFHVDVYDSEGHALNVSQIQSQLCDVVSQSLTRGPAVGILTTDNRDSWYHNYTQLCKDPQNVANLSSIQQSLFVVALDDLPPGYTRDRHYEILCPLAYTGGGTDLNGGNRWHDKMFQISMNHNGIFGFSYEHTLAEGPPLLRFLNTILRDLDDPPSMTPAALGTVPKPRRLDFNLNDSLLTAIKTTNEKTVKLYQSIDTYRYVSKGFGRDFAKSLKLSTDGFIQVHLQLAYYTLHGHLVSTCEVTSMRKFRLGRTESIRCASIPCHNWCKAMVDKNVSTAERLRLLQEAVTHHRWYTNQAMQGQGVDKHLFGLKMTAVENGLDVPEFLEDPIYKHSYHCALFSTTVFLDDGIFVVSPLVKDGYGIYYNVKNDSIHFEITSWKSCSKTDAHKLAKSLEDAFMATYKMTTETAKL